MEDDTGNANQAARRRSTSIAQLVNGPQRKHRRAPSQALPSVPSESATGSNAEEGGAATGSSDLSNSDFEMDAIHSDESSGVEDDEETGLTSYQKKKRRRRRRRNTMMDERVVKDPQSSSNPPDERTAMQTVWRSSMINVFLIGLWYTFSISISMYNKWMFNPKNFDYPLFTTCLHMVVQFILASAVLYFIPSFRPGRSFNTTISAGTAQPQQQQQQQQPTDPNKPIMTRWFYLTRIAPCGAATGLDIGLGNRSLPYITLTFYTMCKSSALAFVLLFAFAFGLESPSWRLVAIIASMTVGVIMLVAGETTFNALGFILVMGSAFFSGFRWSLTQILLVRHPATSNPFSSIFFLAPAMLLSLLVIAIPVETPAGIAEGLHKLYEARGAAMGSLVLLFPGCLAFLMVASEFALLQRTSVVTLSICGIFKEVLTIAAARIVWHDTMTPINILGLAVMICSVAAYNYLKINKMRDNARSGAGGAGYHAAPTEDHDTDMASGSAMEPTTPFTDPRLAKSDGPLKASTKDLIRTSLSIPTHSQSPTILERSAAGNGFQGDGVRHSPVKRQEDLE